MKKVIFMLGLLFGLNTFASIHLNSSTRINNQQRRVAYGAVFRQGYRIQAQVQFTITEDGKQIDVIYIDGQRVNVFPDTRFIPLNPNNDFAKKYNYTHTVSTNQGTIYVILE